MWTLCPGDVLVQVWLEVARLTFCLKHVLDYLSQFFEIRNVVWTQVLHLSLGAIGTTCSLKNVLGVCW